MGAGIARAHGTLKTIRHGTGRRRTGRARMRQQEKLLKMATVYDDHTIFTGEEFRTLLRALDARELRTLLRATYRREGTKVKRLVADRAGHVGIRDGSRMARASLRVFAYSRGGGFMVTANPRNRQGYYKSRQDRTRPQQRWRYGHPVGMWLNSGSWKSGERVTKLGGNRGRLYAYHFVENGEQDALKMVRNDVLEELQRQLGKRLGKMGIARG